MPRRVPNRSFALRPLLSLILATTLVLPGLRSTPRVYADPRVSVLAFSATRDSATRALLYWVTAEEIDNAGFEVYRGTTSGGPYPDSVSGILIPSLGSGGGEYQRSDLLGLDPGTTYHYALVAVAADGVTVTVGTTSLAIPADPTETPTASPTPTATDTPPNTPTATRTPTPTHSPTPTVPPSPTRTRTPTRTATPTRTPTLTRTPTRTATSGPPRSATPTNTATPDAAPGASPAASPTPSPVDPTPSTPPATLPAAPAAPPVLDHAVSPTPLSEVLAPSDLPIGPDSPDPAGAIHAGHARPMANASGSTPSFPAVSRLTGATGKDNSGSREGTILKLSSRETSPEEATAGPGRGAQIAAASGGEVLSSRVLAAAALYLAAAAFLAVVVLRRRAPRR